MQLNADFVAWWKSDDLIRRLKLGMRGFLLECVLYAQLNDGLPENPADAAEIFGLTPTDVTWRWRIIAPFFRQGENRRWHCREDLTTAAAKENGRPLCESRGGQGGVRLRGRGIIPAR